MTAVLTVAGADISGVSFDATVTVGRDAHDQQPEASVLGVTIQGWKPAGKLGDPVVLSDAAGRMFGGTVTDFDSTLEAESGRWLTRLSAVGPLADLGRAIVGDDPWPQETDSQRIKRVLDLIAAPASVNPNIGGPQILARDVDHKPAMDICEETASSALGILWEQPADPTTPIRYQTQRLRAWGPIATLWSEMPAGKLWSQMGTARWADMYSDVAPLPGEPGELTIAAGSVLAEVKFAQRISDWVRCVHVVYGLAPADEETDPGEGEMRDAAGKERPEVIAGAGIPEVKWETVLAQEMDAIEVADSILRSRREPTWLLSEIAMPLHLLPGATVTAIRGALAVGLRLTVEGIAFDAPCGVTWQGYVEGWQHEVGGDYHRLILHTSDRQLTEPADRWQDVAPALTWSTVSAAETWETAVEV